MCALNMLLVSSTELYDVSSIGSSAEKGLLYDKALYTEAAGSRDLPSWTAVCGIGHGALGQGTNRVTLTLAVLLLLRLSCTIMRCACNVLVSCLNGTFVGTD